MLDKRQRHYFRSELRSARAEVLKDAENFSQILFALERLGSIVYGPNGNLKKYEPRLRELAEESAFFLFYSAYLSTTFEQLFHILRQARNDSMHVGAFARHAAKNSVLISLVLEDALMGDAETLSEFMVTEPITAEMWHPLGIIRQKMLANSFSFLPVWTEQPEARWKLVSDASLARYLRCNGSSERERRLAKPLQDVVTNGDLTLIPANCYSSDTKVGQIKDTIDQRPILVFGDEGREHLLGLLAAFDLL